MLMCQTLEYRELFFTDLRSNSIAVHLLAHVAQKLPLPFSGAFVLQHLADATPKIGNVFFAKHIPPNALKPNDYAKLKGLKFGQPLHPTDRLHGS